MGVLSSSTVFPRLNVSNIELTASTPVPSGSDITGLSGAALTSGDFSITNNSAHWYIIPMSAPRYSDIAVMLYHPTAFDTSSITLSVYHMYHTGLTATLLASISYAPVNNRTIHIIPDAVGTGGQSLTASGTSIDRHAFVVPALRSLSPYVGIMIQCATAPTTGELRMRVLRRA